MASLKTNALGSALLLAFAGLTTPACEDDARIEEEDGGSGGVAGSGGKAGSGGSKADGGAPSSEGGAAGAGTAACEEIGSLCHDAESDPLGAECHELGHVGDGEVCLERYDECITFCTEYIEGLGGTGQGGAAHGGAAHGGAGGHGGG